VRFRRALVTGASAGLGAEFARQLAARGCDLVLVARRRDRLEEVADEVRRSAAHVEVLVADLATDAGRTAVAARLASEEHPVDLLVNNAGFGAYGRFDELDLDTHRRMLEVNCVAVTVLAHAALGRMRAVGHGGIVNVASTAAFQADPHGAVYGASKAFVLSLSQAIHEEARGDGVHVVALCPGVTPTEFQGVAAVAVPLPDAALTTAPQVVRAALRALGRNRAIEVPGLVNRIGAAASSVGPAAVSRRLSGLLHAGFAGRR
jgi:hypothetical protein